MTAIVMIPGYGNSGPAHWMSLWQARMSSARRIEVASWETPDPADWTGAIDQAVAAQPAPPLVIAHSLGCLALLHWQAAGPAPLAGAFLVAPPDPAGPLFPPAAATFGLLPPVRLAKPALCLASDDDIYDPDHRARDLLHAAGAAVIPVGALGHINADSNLGEWPEGLRLLAAFRAGLRV